jgi:hypothetical protein
MILGSFATSQSESLTWSSMPQDLPQGASLAAAMAEHEYGVEAST